MKNMIRRFFSLLICVAAALSVSACSEKVYIEDENVELINPVGVTINYVTVESMDLYDSKIYPGIVYPTVTEYALETTQEFLTYKSMPGDVVKKGSDILLTNTKSIDDRIKDFKSTLNDMKTEYVEYMADANKQLEEKKELMNKYEEICYNFETMSDTEKNSYGGKNLAFYYSEYNKYDIYYRQAMLDVEKQEEVIKERTELFDLDYNYQKSQYNKLVASRGEASLESDIDGVVVGITYLESGNRMNSGVPYAAVGDITNKVILSDYINKGIIGKAIDVYAIVNGKRYEVDYHALDTDEYENLKEKYEDVYSTFSILDPDGEVEFGSLATIVVVNARKKDCVCIPKAAIHKNDEGSFVYSYNNDESEIVYVKTGVSEGSYIEILYGLSVGDKVLCDDKVKLGNKTAQISYGKVGNKFSDAGYLYYPKTEWIVNPVEYGTIYLDELCVSRYQKVEKGQVIAKIHVVKDDIDLKRKERTLLRAEEKLAELIKDDEERAEEEKLNTKAIANQEEYISDLKEEIAKIKSDAKIKEIKAPYAGIITDVRRFSTGDLCNSKAQIACISKDDSSYIIVEDTNGKLTYGNKADITYKNADGIEKKVIGEVVSCAKLALTSQMKTDYALIRIPKEDIGDMAGSSMGYEGWWNRSRFTVSLNLRTMDNVLLVPRSAVVDIDGYTYVTVKDENGNLKNVSFIAGGFDATYYWVVEGLSEGMVVCLD